jgi:hypothetical protein
MAAVSAEKREGDPNKTTAKKSGLLAFRVLYSLSVTNVENEELFI